MKKRICSRMLAALLLLCLLPLGQTVLAEPEASFSVDVQAQGNVPAKPETYTLVLTGDEGAPMPEGSRDGQYTMKVEGPQVADFPAIVYQSVGVYHYAIVQKPGTNSSCTYDDTRYEITVTVTNQKSEPGLEVTIAIRNSQTQEKVEQVEFRNAYAYPPEIPQTGESGNLPLMLGLWVLSLLAMGLLWKQRKTA